MTFDKNLWNLFFPFLQKIQEEFFFCYCKTAQSAFISSENMKGRSSPIKISFSNNINGLFVPKTFLCLRTTDLKQDNETQVCLIAFESHRSVLGSRIDNYNRLNTKLVDKMCFKDNHRNRN